MGDVWCAGKIILLCWMHIDQSKERIMGNIFGEMYSQLARIAIAVSIQARLLSIGGISPRRVGFGIVRFRERKFGFPINPFGEIDGRTHCLRTLVRPSHPYGCTP